MKTPILTLPKPPTENQYRRVFRGRPVISAEGRQFRKDVEAHVKEMGIEKIDGRLCVEIDYYLPDRRKRDIDNILKALFDAVCLAGVYEDDEHIDMLLARKMKEIVKGGLVVMTITAIKGDGDGA